MILQTLDAEQPPPSEKKVSSKVTKAQRRAQQAEFNRQLWTEAYVLFSSFSIASLDTLYSVIYVSNRTTEKRPRPSTSSKPSQMSP